MTRNNSELLELCINEIKKSKNIYLASHINPDGDNIGSLLSLGMALKKLNKKVSIVKVDDIPRDYEFLPGLDLFIEPNISEPIDLFISLDSSDLERLGVGKEIALRANKIINIDHHVTNDNFGNINIVDPLASATGELVYDLIKKLDVEIDSHIATCIYVAISSDTGSFMYDNTTRKTHLIAADLLDKGINKNEIIVNLYQSKSMGKTKLFIKALNSLEMYCNKRVGIITVTQEMLNECNTKMEDTEGIISFVRDIEGIEIACILKEFKEDEVKLSLRSKSIVDVSQICLIFNGGGHSRAAGCTINDNVENAKIIILNEIKKHLGD